MSKINPVVTSAFNIAYTAKEIEKLEGRLFDVLEEVRTIQGPQGKEGPKGPKGDQGPKGTRRNWSSRTTRRKR
jgi:predicted fused transcriptional regulator/phosphomethylpyrimidine kinase